MNSTASPHWVVLLALVFLLLPLGTILLRKGFRPRRKGTTPHCARCEYNLTGLTSEKCPECGATLGIGDVVYGEPHQKAGRVVGGIVCLLIALGLLLPVVRTVNWYQFRPTAWLITDLSSTNAADARRAWSELDRRYLAGKLSAGQNSQLIDLGLQEQTKATLGPIGSNLIDHLGRACLAGEMSPAQQQKLVAQALRVTLEARPTTIQGRRAPVRMRHIDRAPSAPFWVAYKVDTFLIDGEKLPNRGGMSGSASGCGGAGAFTTALDISGVGRHKLKGSAHVELWNGPMGNESASTLIGSTDVDATAETEVLAEEPEGYIECVSGATLDGQVRSSITPKDFKFKAQPNPQFEMVLDVKAPPIGVAVEVLVRTQGREYKIGTITVIPGESTNWHVSQGWPAAQASGPDAFTECDVILRSSADVARDSVDLFKIWAGELVYEDQPVKLETPALPESPSKPADEATP